MIYTRNLLILFILLLYGCGYSEVKVENKLINSLAEKYGNNVNIESQNTYIQQFSDWYNSFNSKELHDLIFLALENNLDITKALYNLQASALQLGNYRQSLFPSLSAQSQYLQNNYSKSASQHLLVQPKSTMLTIGVTASYELDIWGKNYSAYKGAQNKINANKADFDGIKISIIASIMNLWINLMTLREEIALLNEKIIYIESVLEIQEANYGNGAINITDLFQQQSQLLAIQNQLKDIKYAEAETLRSINILLGRDPLEQLVILSNKLPTLPKLPNNQLDIIVLANRPDIKSAFYQLVAAEWEAKVANLSRLPSFSIQSVGEVGSTGLSISFDKWILRNILQAGVPLFQAGALYNKEQAQKLLAKSSVVTYKQVVFNAINELKTSLDNESKYIKGVENLTKQIYLMEEAKNQLHNKYLNGDSNYLEFLNANSKVIDLKVSLIEKYKNMLLNRIVLYRALGIGVKDKDKINDKT